MKFNSIGTRSHVADISLKCLQNRVNRWQAQATAPGFQYIAVYHTICRHVHIKLMNLCNVQSVFRSIHLYPQAPSMSPVLI